MGACILAVACRIPSSKPQASLILTSKGKFSRKSGVEVKRQLTGKFNLPKTSVANRSVVFQLFCLDSKYVSSWKTHPDFNYGKGNPTPGSGTSCLNPPSGPWVPDPPKPSHPNFGSSSPVPVGPGTPIHSLPHARQGNICPRGRRCHHRTVQFQPLLGFVFFVGDIHLPVGAPIDHFHQATRIFLTLDN